MTQEQDFNYPPGIEHRTPRPRHIPAGALLGGIIGLTLINNAGGALASGPPNAGAPAELPSAVRQRLAENGLEMIRYHRLGAFGAKIIFKYGESFGALESHAPKFPPMSPIQIDDWLYGDLIEQQLEAFINKYPLQEK